MRKKEKRRERKWKENKEEGGKERDKEGERETRRERGIYEVGSEKCQKVRERGKDTQNK